MLLLNPYYLHGMRAANGNHNRCQLAIFDDHKTRFQDPGTRLLDQNVAALCSPTNMFSALSPEVLSIDISYFGSCICVQLGLTFLSKSRFKGTSNLVPFREILATHVLVTLRFSV